MIGIIIFTITALILGTILVLTDNYFKKEDDKIEEYLPGYNCGACGFGSCAGMKEAIQENPENYKKCRLIKNDQAIEYFESLKQKGFTLIELLAVIIIISIIAVITIPIINNSLENSKKNLAQTSAQGYTKAIDEYLLHEELNKNKIKLNGTYNINENGNIYNSREIYELEYTGAIPTAGTLTYLNNELQSGCITINNHKITITNGKVTNTEKGNCEFISVENRILALADEYIDEFEETTITSSGLYYVSNINNDVSIEENPTDGWIKILYKETGEITILEYSLKFGNIVVNYEDSTKSLSTELTQAPEVECPDPTCPVYDGYYANYSTVTINNIKKEYICAVENDIRFCVRGGIDESDNAYTPIFNRNKQVLDSVFNNCAAIENGYGYYCTETNSETSTAITVRKNGNINYSYTQLNEEETPTIFASFKNNEYTWEIGLNPF